MRITRWAGPYGPQMVSKALERRMSYMPSSSAMRNGTLDLEDLSEYLYHNWALKASGEKAMTTHLAPFAYARRPLIDMLLPDRVQMPVTFIYGGEYDWMDYRHGLQVVQRLTSAEKRAQLIRIPRSGHQVFIDNPEDFNHSVVKALLQS